MKKVITFGEIMLRLAPNGYMRILQEPSFEATFGGAEANVAVALANFGDNVAFVSKVPDHALGKAAISELKKYGVDTSFISLGGNRLGVYYMEKGANQRPSVCIYDREGSSFQESKSTDFDWDKIFEDSEWFHFTGITPALGDALSEICLAACKEAKKRNISVSCDLNYRAKLWPKEKASYTMEKLCSYVDLLIANEEDAKQVFGIEAENTDVLSGKIDRVGYQFVAEELKKRFNFSMIAITLRRSHSASVNDWSALVYDGNEFFYSQEYHIDHIVDRVGSGDSFGAGLIYALRHDYDAQNAVEFAVASAVLKHSIEGDFNRVSLKEVENLVNGNHSGRVQR